MRLDKFLSEMNQESRSRVKELIRKGHVSVNGERCVSPQEQVDETKDQITLDGVLIKYEKYVYYMLNKPKGVVSATRDKLDDTVLSLLRRAYPEGIRDGLFPVGRLDKDTEGLLIITNDGALAHRLLSPQKHVSKIYRVVTVNPLSDEDIRKLEEGVDIGDEKPTAPAEARRISDHELILSIHEGRFHQVKRMLEAVGNRVDALERTGFGKLMLDDGLKRGECRRLTPEEVKLLNESQGNIDVF